MAVNGNKIQTPDHWVDVASDRVTLDGRPLGGARKVYLLLYKPKGYLTTYKDPEGRRTVYNLIPGIDQFISPVGRLDLDSSGLLIMTNDTDFGNHIMSPESKIAKTYLVKSSLLLSDEQLDRLRAGIELADGPTRPAMVARIRDSARYTFFEITISEGRNRQVRRMVEALGAKVLKLVRVAIAAIRIGDLEIGTYRELTAAEVSQLHGRGLGRTPGGRTAGGRSEQQRRHRRGRRQRGTQERNDGFEFAIVVGFDDGRMPPRAVIRDSHGRRFDGSHDRRRRR